MGACANGAPELRGGYGVIVEWENEQAMVKAYDITIEQRHPELLPLFFGPKPPGMPEAD